MAGESHTQLLSRLSVEGKRFAEENGYAEAIFPVKPFVLHVVPTLCDVVDDGTKTISWKKLCPADKACVFYDPNIGYVSLPLDICQPSRRQCQWVL